MHMHVNPAKLPPKQSNLWMSASVELKLLAHLKAPGGDRLERQQPEPEHGRSGTQGANMVDVKVANASLPRFMSRSQSP
jgi:hypothetical protein